MEASLSGEPQDDVFNRDVFMRLPNTKNLKSGEKATEARVINKLAEPIDVDLFALDKDDAFDRFAKIMTPKFELAARPGEVLDHAHTEMFREVYIENGKKKLSKIKYYKKEVE